jgi:hypothetical protein
MAFPWAAFTLGLEILNKIGVPLYNQLIELVGDKIPTVEQLRSQSNLIWAKIAEEESKP